MDLYEEESSICCYIHPEQSFAGICSLCLKQRLLILASKQSDTVQPSSSSSARVTRTNTNLPRIFSFNSIQFYPSAGFEAIKDQEDVYMVQKAVTDLSDIRINREYEHCYVSWTHHQALAKTLPRRTEKSLVEHQKSQASLRWRKRIGQLLRLFRLRRSSSCHGATRVEEAKVRKQGPVRTLTKRKADKQ